MRKYTPYFQEFFLWKINTKMKTKLYTFGNDLKKRNNVHILKWEILRCEDWRFSLVENEEEKPRFVKWISKNQTVVSRNPITLDYLATIEISTKLYRLVTENYWRDKMQIVLWYNFLKRLCDRTVPGMKLKWLFHCRRPTGGGGYHRFGHHWTGGGVGSENDQF